VGGALLFLGSEDVALSLCVDRGGVLGGEARFLAWLMLSGEGVERLPRVEALELPSPYGEMALAREAAFEKGRGVKVIQASMEALEAQGAMESAGWLASELARWHLGHGRLREVFSLLTPHKASENWGIRWQVYRLLAQAYAQMKRTDLAHHALEEATRWIPKPLPPVLVGELRLVTAGFLLAEGEQDAAAIQLRAARDTFRAAGDGARLGRYLMLSGERHWQRGAFEEAKGFFGRALELFRGYRDGLGAQEAQLKLGLVLHEAPASILGAR
jgi:tetratricopeptide (TPR) repeat protein